MAQKKLLFILVMLFMTKNSLAFDMNWTLDVSNRARKDFFARLANNYQKSKKMQEKRLITKTRPMKGKLRVFVSSSMGIENLKSYVKASRKYQAILVFNGLPEGSFKELSKLITKISANYDQTYIQIDDVSFKKFKVNEVPTIILSQEDWQAFKGEDETLAFDKVIGNIGISNALKLFANEGDLKQLAKERLNGS